jgi:predicted nucleic acid-binding Zn ribbon protein
MPTYVYRREDGSTFEIEQRITEAALTHDPETGQRVERVIVGAGLLFKGSGFYLTDYARPGSGTSKESTGEGKTEGGSPKSETPAASTEPAAPKPAESKPSSAKSD